MTYVFDSSVAFKWAVPEADSDKALMLRDEYVAGIHDLIAPDFFPSELAHALTRAERQKRINTGQALTYWTDVMIDSPRLFPSLSITQRAIKIASAARIGVYDSTYVALAERENCELITADERLVANLQIQFPFIVLLSSMS